MPKINPATAGQKIIVIVGPTASGKSDLGVKIAKKFNGEIISADSRQVYRRMDIGTGKVERDVAKAKRPKTKKSSSGFSSSTLDLKRYYFSSDIRHHLIDVANPKKQFTADDFKKIGQKAIEGILSRGKIPIIVGGTGFYIDVLLGQMPITEVPPNKKLRRELENLEIEELFAKLMKLDPQRAKTIEPKNKRRLIRALEIVLTTDKPVPKQSYELGTKNYEILWLGLRPKNLEQKIKKRLYARLKQGMIKEVINLRKQGLSWKRLDDFGLEYRWISRWLIKNATFVPSSSRGKIQMKNYNLKFKKSEEYTNLLIDIVRYSKRQMTWFKRNKEIYWLAPSKIEGVKSQKETEELAKKFLLA